MIKKICFKLIILLYIISVGEIYAQVINDTFDKAIPLEEIYNCSLDAAYSTIGAQDEKLIASPTNWPAGDSGNDIWFKFIATSKHLSLSVTGKSTGGGSTGGTLIYPLIGLYTFELTGIGYSYTAQTGGFLPAYAVSVFKKGDLIVGKEYYIRISAANKNEGSFKLCINNYSSPPIAGQDFESASILCSKSTFTEHNVLGSGLDNMESFGSCLGRESNTAWYKWVAANDGTLTMDITPLFNTDDIDWVLYDLGPSGDFNNKVLLRCAAGHGINNKDCPSELLYHKTGMNLSSTDIVENSGCGLGGQDGYLKYVELKKGHTYALLVDNYTSGNHGFTIQFGGTSEFEGPKAKINLLSTDFCENNSGFIFTSTGSENYDRLEWNFGEGANIATSSEPNPPPIIYSHPGNKTVTLTMYHGTNCSTRATQTFLVNPKISSSQINGLKSAYCLGDYINLSTDIEVDVTYSWTGPNGFTSNSNEIKILINDVNQAGVYSLKTSKNGCSSDVQSVIIPAIESMPTADFSNNIANLCENTQSYIFTNNSTNYTKVIWNFGIDASMTTSTDHNPPPVSYTSPGPKTISLQVFNKNDCYVIVTKLITVNLKPDLPVINGLKSSYCIGDEIILHTSAESESTYLWTGPNGFTSSLNEIKILVDDPNKAGIYNLKITKNACSSDITSVTVPPIAISPKASFTIINNNLCSPSPSFTFTNTSSNFSSLKWDFGDGADISPGSSNLSHTITYSKPGLKTIKLEAIGNSGCSHIFSQEISVVFGPEKPIIIVNKPDFCRIDSIKLSAPYQEDVVYNWTGPKGFSSNLREPEIPANSPSVAGTYHLTLSKGACTTSTVSVIVDANYQKPIANFSTYPQMPFHLTAPFQVEFFNESKDSDSFLWDFGDGNTSTESNPIHTYLSDGNYIITLTVFKNSICSDVITKGDVKLIDLNSIVIPNTFTPNNDGINDVFAVNIWGVHSYKIQIFNRYGVPLFLSTDINNHWDGTFNGAPLPMGTYYYLINATDFNSISIQKAGPVTIIR
jgi:gliding motility-associated-like protein